MFKPSHAVSPQHTISGVEAPGHPALNSFCALREVLEHWPPANTAGPTETERVVEWLDSHVPNCRKRLGSVTLDAIGRGAAATK